MYVCSVYEEVLLKNTDQLVAFSAQSYNDARFVNAKRYDAIRDEEKFSFPSDLILSSRDGRPLFPVTFCPFLKLRFFFLAHTESDAPLCV